ncbi:MAG TPA: FCD domain-containing protein [Acidimicrobiales bacterium]|nr:FCD domain-containing protein [Acidimicrobiales bacterium]
MTTAEPRAARAVIKLQSRRQGAAVTDEAINGIKEMIVSGALQPGARLPREEELAASLGLSRSSLREAVRSLSLVGILDVRQGDGTYVTSLRPEILLDAMSFVVDFHRDDSVLEFLEVRRLLESAATAMAARRATSAQVAELRALVTAVPADSPAEAFVANDLEFHRRLVALCGNSVLASLLDSISGPTHRARIWRGVTHQHAHERTIEEHLSILDAVEHHWPEIAAARAAVHVAGVEEWLRDRLSPGQPANGPAPGPR